MTSLLDAVGRTPLAELRRLVPVGRARVLVKLESHNPTGSMKDRMALAVVRGAASSCRLPPGGTVVEYTGGSTGTSLAFVCAALGHPITLVTSDAFSREKRDHMRALGATVVELPSEGGRTTRELIRRMIARAAELAGVPGAFYVDQFNNPDAPKGWYPGVADEVLRVSTAEATDMARRLAREEALFGGTSSGANVVAALRVAERLGPDRSVGTLVCDSGLKYLSTDLYSSRA